MTKKYADLEPTIAVEESLDLREQWAAGVALRWIDEHPDQVPGRTITQSRFNALSDQYYVRLYSFQHMVDELGITIVPDPEPTNAELIERKLRELREEPGEWMTYATDSDISGFSQALDAKGVKAPGGDDGH